MTISNYMQPLVSVVIPCYNHENYVAHSIISVLQQQYPYIELMIIDDGSSDGSVATIKTLIEQCQNRFVRFEFRHRPNQGLCHTLNEGLAWAQGAYFCTLASDDMMLPDKIALQIRHFLQHPDTVAVCGGFNLIDDQGNIIDQRVGTFRVYDFQSIFLHRFDLPASSQMIDTKQLRLVGGFNTRTAVEDWDLWLKLSKQGKKISYVPYALINYRSHASNMSKNLPRMYQEIVGIAQQYQREPQYALALYRIQKMYIVRPMQKKNIFLALFLRLKYYIQYRLARLAKA